MSFNVLIVDDSNSMRSVIKKIISLSGFKMDQCMEAENGREALDILGKSWVDVIISDINMPEMNGFQLLNALKDDDLLKDIPVIIVSTESREGRMMEAYSLGAKGFIKKPFLPEEIRKILYDVIGVNNHGEYGNNEADDGDFDF
ncbi:MAG TPA: response regulator [Deltaproteobacteria bacterium]|nr:response regulator [Deltaproteobacteria bacterium]